MGQGRKIRRATMIGFALGIAGAILDFSSGFLILSDSKTTTDMMGVMSTDYSYAAIAWGAGIVVLGILVLATAVMSLSSFGSMRMRAFGFAMITFGAVMFLVGGTMYSGFTPMMEESILSSIGMFAVGGLMVINGALMSRSMM